MALKPDRSYVGDATDISFFMNATAERGCMSIHGGTAGSGAAMDQANAVAVPTGSTSSGTYPIGLLVNDVVNKNLTQTHLNQYKDEVQLGGKVTLLKRGSVTTNCVDTGIGATSFAGRPAYYLAQSFTGADGTAYTNVFVLSTTNTGSATPQVGRFRSNKDEDGYVKVDINIL
jgi:hypothetical protein